MDASEKLIEAGWLRVEARALRMAIADAERAINAAWALDIDTTRLRRLKSAALDALAVLEG